MFWKRKSPEQLIEDLRAVSTEVIWVLKCKWEQFQTQVPMEPDVPLELRIELFMKTARWSIYDGYPIMRSAPGDLIWEMTFRAVIESKTHTPDEVSSASAAMAAKNAKR